MGNLEKWKAAKSAYEKATGKSKPSEKGKFLGIGFDKSSGIEDALKNLDAALPTHDVEAVYKALNGFKATVDNYLPTIENMLLEIKQIKVTNGRTRLTAEDTLLETELVKLIGELCTIYKQSKADFDLLATDNKAIMTVAQAIGPKACTAISHFTTRKDKNINAWLNSKDASLTHGKKIDSASQKAHSEAKKLFSKFAVIYDEFMNKNLQKKMERGKGVELARKFLNDYMELNLSIDKACWRTQLTEWSKAQTAFFLGPEDGRPTKAELKEDSALNARMEAANTVFKNWQNTSDAWKAAVCFGKQMEAENTTWAEADQAIKDSLGKPWPIGSDRVGRERAGAENWMEQLGLE